MAISSISGVSGSMQPVRTSLEPIKGVSGEQKSEKKPAETVVEQENKDNFAMKTGTNNQKLNEVKGVQEVDVKV